MAGAGTILLLQKTGIIPPQPPLINLFSSSLILYTAATSAVLPDVDEIRSRIGRKLLFLSIPFLILEIIGKFTGTKWFKHRGITHYMITWFLLSALIAVPFLPVASSNDTLTKAIGTALLFFPLGYLSHILLDLISGRIALFYPILKKPIGIILFPRNSIREIMLRFALLFLAIYITFAIL